MKGNFQIIILVVFIIAGILGVLVFSGAIPLEFGSDENVGQGTVVIWGTQSSSAVLPIFEEFNKVNQSFIVQYVQKFPDTFNDDLLEALASGEGPDMFFLPDDLTLSYNNKIVTVPYGSYPIASFKNNFAGAGEVFTTTSGILAFPITIDPLVMYYNRSMLDAKNVVYPPVYWDEFSKLVPLLSEKDDSNRIIKSAVAMGQYSNVNNAKDIISTLFMQAGSPIVAERNGFFVSLLGENVQYDLGSVLKFYTDFTDPLQSVYSWNRSLPGSRDAFSSENLAFYFGHASEFQSLVNANPNQNFFVAPMPQIRGASFKLTGARVTGIAISNLSKNFNTALIAASLMTSGDFASKFANALGVAPARRDLLATLPQDAYSPTFYSSALYSRSWLDPSPENTDNIFRGMVDAVLSNNLSVQAAVRDASSKLGLLLIK